MLYFIGLTFTVIHPVLAQSRAIDTGGIPLAGTAALLIVLTLLVLIWVLQVKKQKKSIAESERQFEAVKKEAEDRLKIMTQEMELAKTLQEAVLPHDFPFHPAYEVNAYMRAARQVGGDFYDYYSLDDNRVGLLIADVSGKGVPAAFIMSMSAAIMKTVAQTERAPRLVLTEVNRRLCEHGIQGLFVTMFYGIVDIRTGQLTYSNGGHNNPYIVKSGGGVQMLEPTNNLVVAAFEETRYVQKEAVLAPGDTLFLYTDGFTEAFNAEHEMFHETRLIESLNKAHDQPLENLIETLLDDVQAFVGSHEQSDDLTCLAFRFKEKAGLEDRLKSFQSAAEAVTPEAQFQLEISSHTDRVDAVLAKIDEF